MIVLPWPCTHLPLVELCLLGADRTWMGLDQ
jgi:hypothetical protein